MTLLQTAQRKARYGHRDWIYWKDANGQQHAEPKSRDAIKKAMLSCGTKKRFTIVHANNGDLMYGNWQIGVIMLNNLKHGI